MKDDAKNAMAKNAPQKAPVIMIGSEWESLSNEQKALALALIAMGVRDDSVMAVKSHEWTCDENGSGRRYSVLITKDKRFVLEPRIIKIGCNCTAKHEAKFCLVHNRDFPRLAAPFSRKEIDNIKRVLGALGHSFRRTCAMLVRREIHAICKSKKEPIEWFSITSFLKRQGWDVMGTFFDYTRGFETLSAMGDAKWLPGGAITRSVKNSPVVDNRRVRPEKHKKGRPRRTAGT